MSEKFNVANSELKFDINMKKKLQEFRLENKRFHMYQENLMSQTLTLILNSIWKRIAKVSIRK